LAAPVKVGKPHWFDERSGLIPAAMAERISAFQAAGKTVAMAGGGINDAPALVMAFPRITVVSNSLRLFRTKLADS
jgi:cation transport ATPase